MDNTLPLTLPAPVEITVKTQPKYWIRGFIGASVMAVAAMLAPVVTEAWNSQRDFTQSKQNLKQLGLALNNYHETYGTFPPAYTVDAEGNRLHSWRTLLLPFLGQKELYDRIDFTKPWNDPANEFLKQEQISCFSTPASRTNRQLTSFQVVVGEMTCFPPNGAISYRDIQDGTSNTVAVVEVTKTLAVAWMSPRDLTEKELVQMHGTPEFQQSRGSHLLMADGTTRYVTPTINPVTYQSLVTRYGDYFGCDF